MSLSEVVLNFADVISAFVGSVLGFLFAFIIFSLQARSEVRKMQVDTALAFYDELTSADFARARSEAAKVFEAHADAHNLNAFYLKLSAEKREPVQKVLSFFRRLHLVVAHGRIDREMAVDLFSGEFIRWYFRWLDKMVPNDWETRRRINGLHSWFEANMPRHEYDEKRNKVLKEMEKGA
jgi:uncharacterized membrane protein YccC